MSERKIYPEDFDEEIGSSEEEMKAPRKNTTGAKKSKGKAVALTILVVGTLVAGSIFGTKAVHNFQETKRANDLIASYQTEEYVRLPKTVTSDRAYDITYADGEKLVKSLQDKKINYIKINNQFYTPNGDNIAIIGFDVTYNTFVDAIKVKADGQTLYMAPQGYTLNGKYAYKQEVVRKYRVAPVSEDYSYIQFEGAAEWHMIEEPQIVSTLPYDVIKKSTLICDVPDGATLNEYNECTGTLDLAPKKR